MDERDVPVCAEESVEETELEVSAEESKREEKSKSHLKSVYELFSTILVALVVVMAIFSLCFRQVVVDGDSMNDTLQNHDRLLLWTAFYTPERGDIVVVYQEDEPDEPLIKRVIAVAGDTLRLDVSENAVYLKKAGTTDEVLLDESAYVNYPLGWGIYWTQEEAVTVPEGHIFVMGDHRNDSKDSRTIGFVSTEDVVGHAVFRIFPFNTIGLV